MGFTSVNRSLESTSEFGSSEVANNRGVDPLEKVFLSVFFEKHFEDICQFAIKLVLKVCIKFDSVSVESFIAKLFHHSLLKFLMSFNLLMKRSWAIAKYRLSAKNSKRTLCIKHGTFYFINWHGQKRHFRELEKDLFDICVRASTF